MGGRRRGRGALLPTGEGREGKGIRENREGKEREEPGRKGGGEEGTGIGPQFEKNDPPPPSSDGWLRACTVEVTNIYGHCLLGAFEF